MVMATQQFPLTFKIVVALDASEYSEIVLEHALDQAARHDAAELHFLVVAENGEDDDELERLRKWLTDIVVEGLATFQANRPSARARVHIRAGKPTEEIVSLAGEIQASLLVIGRYGLHRWRKSVTDHVVESAPCPTLVVGLTERVVETQPQCPACIEVRADSDGERWFCDAHTGDDRLRWTTLVGAGTSSMQGTTTL